MRKTALLLPLAAGLMLGTAAYGQSNMNSMNNQPYNPNMQNSRMQNGDMRGMDNATMYNNGRMDPRQSRAGGMPIDQETSINGIQAACTGVGDQQENKARWSSYPVKLVVAGDHGQFYAGEHVSVMGRGGRQMASMTCNGPWVLMRLEPGSYRARVDLPGHAAKTISFTAPYRGQREVTVHFASNDRDWQNRDQYRASPTSYQRPQGKPMDNTTYGNGAVDQPPQQPR